MSVVEVVYYALGALALLVFLSVMVLALTWVERKALARIQMRMGPMRVGFHGTLQPVADALKLLLKEDILPSWADRKVYWLAPLAVFVPSLLLWVTIPVGRDLVLRNLDLGLFYIVAFSVLSILGLGPMRVGFHGTLQPVADALKLLLKEDILPSWADRKVYWLAPLAVFVPSLLLWVTIPVGRDLVLRNLDLGLFYIVAFSVLSILGLVMAGWGSANKYAILGGLRAAGQFISYEIPFIMAILAVAMMAQSLDLEEIVDDQATVAYILVQPLGLFIFLVAGLAELGRTPFDIHHAESEVVGGPFVEYSGAHWAVFFLAEYINTFTIAALTVLFFLGGWRWPEMPLDGAAHSALSAIWFIAKAYVVILVIFWIRGTYPRLRIDQLMAFGWKLLVPLSFINIVITAIVLFYGWPLWALTLISLVLLGGTVGLIFKVPRTTMERNTVRVYPARIQRTAPFVPGTETVASAED